MLFCACSLWIHAERSHTGVSQPELEAAVAAVAARKATKAVVTNRIKWAESAPEAPPKKKERKKRVRKKVEEEEYDHEL